jgi:hypothetical protein
MTSNACLYAMAATACSSDLYLQRIAFTPPVTDTGDRFIVPDTSCFCIVTMLPADVLQPRVCMVLAFLI